ncbi:glycoside hydrolase superfamily [Suillus subluteus]|nr:glycoside hydrolase superfamily [Suillus subluteus]
MPVDSYLPLLQHFNTPSLRSPVHISSSRKSANTELLDRTQPATASCVLAFGGTPTGLLIDFIATSWPPCAVCEQIRANQAVLMDSWVAAICGLLSLIQRQGQSFSTRWQWNATVGKLIDRPGRVGDWGYINTDGLGLLEYMYLCEDMEMEPIMAVWAGYSLNGASLPENELTPYIQQAIDQINFVIGNPATSEPAALRASLGHPEPFPLQYVEIGNEDFFALESYIYRWRDFVGNLTATFPQLKFIATSYPFDPILDPIPKQYDNHVYQTPGCDIFGTPANGRLVYPDMQGSSAEAAFMTGLERNSDIVLAASTLPTIMAELGLTSTLAGNPQMSPDCSRMVGRTHYNSVPESTMPFHQRWRRQAKPRQAGGRGGGNRKRGPGWSASGAELSRWMGMAPADDSDSDFPTRTPRKPFGGAGVFGAGGPISAGGAGLLPGDLAAAAAAGTPSNLGKIGDAALADADPLGVNTNVTFDEVGGLDDPPGSTTCNDPHTLHLQEPTPPPRPPRYPCSFAAFLRRAWLM